MSAQHLSGTPHRVKGRTDVWWYEEKTGICLLRDPSDGNTQPVLVPWRAIRYALKRLDAK